MRKRLLLLAALGAFASCKKSDDSAVETTVPETIKEMNIAVTASNSFSSAPVQQGTGNFNFLGYGYDIFDKYADAGLVKAQVINASAYAAAYPLGVDLNRSTSGGAEPSYGIDAKDFLSKISPNLLGSQGIALFNNTITTAFPGQDAFSGKYIYARYVYYMRWKTIRTSWDGEVKNYLNPNFRVDVQNLTPQTLVKKYGTHILSGISLGEKFIVDFQAKTTNVNKLHASVAGFTYTLKKVFGVNTGYLDPFEPAELNAISEPKISYEAIGGDLSKITEMVTDKGTLVRFNNWIPTCTEDKASFIDIVPQGLVPLYDLIADPVKKAEVKSYITSYIEQNRIKL